MNAGGLPQPAFWAGKRVLLTGHTGFKGSWTALWLTEMNARIAGFALTPEYPSLFRLARMESGLNSIIGDLRDVNAVQAAIQAIDPQIVIHMAAQPLVRRSLVYPGETFATNVQGTANLLDALRDCPALQAVLIVTSDKVYANDSEGRPFVEGDRLGGKDPYSASKAAVELLAQSFAGSYFIKRGVPVATARAGNIIGGGDFAEDRIVPDIVRAVRAAARPALRHPEATRPWQHVLDCICGYLLFIEALTARTAAVPRALNFGPDPAAPVTVAKLAEAMLIALGEEPCWDHVPVPDSVEMQELTLDGTLARKSLGWQNRLPANHGVHWTADWYRAFAKGKDIRAITLGQITAYRRLAVHST